MRVAHVLRKYNPAEWGGTESAVKGLLDGLRAHCTEVVVYCPKCQSDGAFDPFQAAGYPLERFHAFIPVWGIPPAQRQQLISIGGNIMSLDLIWKLQWAPGLSVIHTHALNRLGGIGAAIAKVRRIPFVVTIHGGVLDLPAAVQQKLLEPLRGGIEWGKVFGWVLRSRRVLEQADAVITCNRREAALIKEKYPDKIVFAQPHGIPAGAYVEDQRSHAHSAFPEIVGKTILLIAGRIDPVKNQGWIIQQLPRAIERHPQLHVVLAGSCTDEAYGKQIKKEIRNLGLESHVTLTGGLPVHDPKLIGLFQTAAVVVLPSVSETFGLVILEAWASGTPVLSSRTSGALDLIREGENGLLFDIQDPASFHHALDGLLQDPVRSKQLAEAGRRRAQAEFDTTVLAGRVKLLYEELIGES